MEYERIFNCPQHRIRLVRYKTITFALQLLMSRRWSDFYGPLERADGFYTNILRNNFSSPYSLGFPMYGYVNDTKPQPQTFESDSIVVLSDGACASACAIFMELMKTQAGVQSITVGGRKQNGPMQAVGGTKGFNVEDLGILSTTAGEAYWRANWTQRPLFDPYREAGLVKTAWQVVSIRYTCYNY